MPYCICIDVYRNKSGQLVLGDVITALDARPAKTAGDLFDILDDCKVGQNVELTIVRNGRPMPVELTLAEKDPNMD